jgi:hypothetical protein
LRARVVPLGGLLMFLSIPFSPFFRGGTARHGTDGTGNPLWQGAVIDHMLGNKLAQREHRPSASLRYRLSG